MNSIIQYVKVPKIYYASEVTLQFLAEKNCSR